MPFRSARLIKNFALWFYIVGCVKLLVFKKKISSLRKELYLKLCFYYENYKKWTPGCRLITYWKVCISFDFKLKELIFFFFSELSFPFNWTNRKNLLGMSWFQIILQFIEGNFFIYFSRWWQEWVTSLCKSILILVLPPQHAICIAHAQWPPAYSYK